MIKKMESKYGYGVGLEINLRPRGAGIRLCMEEYVKGLTIKEDIPCPETKLTLLLSLEETGKLIGELQTKLNSAQKVYIERQNKITPKENK